MSENFQYIEIAIKSCNLTDGCYTGNDLDKYLSNTTINFLSTKSHVDFSKEHDVIKYSVDYSNHFTLDQEYFQK